MGLIQVSISMTRKLNAYLRGAKAALSNRKKLNPYSQRMLIEQWEMGYLDQKEGLLTEDFKDEK